MKQTLTETLKDDVIRLRAMILLLRQARMTTSAGRLSAIASRLERYIAAQEKKQ